MQSKNHEDHIAGKGFYFDDTLQLGAQVYSDASSDENSGCESSSGQVILEAQRETKRKSTLLH